MGQVFLRVVPFSPSSVIPLMLQTRLHFNLTLIRRTSGQVWGLSDISGALNFEVTLLKAIYYRK